MRRSTLGAAIVLVLGGAVRLATVDDVLTTSGVRLAPDTDPHYHVLRAERMLLGTPGAPWRDPALSWPDGAEVPWPPAFDVAIAGLARLWTAHPDREDLAKAASVLPVLLGLGSLLVAAALGRRLGAGGGWLAAAILALLPAHAEYTVFGRGDQHAAEILLSTAVLLAFWIAVRAPDRRRLGSAAAAMALLVALSAWTWPGSTLFLVVPAAFTAIWHLVAPGDDAVARRAPAALLAGAGGGAALLALSVAALGAPGALFRFGVSGAGGLHVAASAGVAGFGGLLLAARARVRPARAARRLLEVLVAAAAPAAALLAPSAALRDGVVEVLGAAGGRAPWYRIIEEYLPLVGSGRGSLADDLRDVLTRFGLVGVAALGTAVLLSRRWRDKREQRPESVLLGVWTAVFVGLTLEANRFGLYAAVPLAIGAAIALTALGSSVGVRWGGPLAAAALVSGGVLLIAPTVPRLLGPTEPGVSEDELAAMAALRGAPSAPGREGVLAPWSLGHAIQYHAGRPVLVSPFGSAVGVAAMRDAAAFWSATSAREAEALLARRRIGLVLFGNPASEVHDLHPFAPAGTPVAVEERRDGSGESLHPAEPYWRLVPVLLYFRDGASLDGFRLLYEGRATSERPLEDERLKIFGAVPGAKLDVSGAAPGAPVRATVSARTNTGRRFSWSAEATADAAGRATLRLPYATGANGAVEAGSWTVASGERERTLEIGDGAVLRGASVACALDTGAMRRAP